MTIVFLRLYYSLPGNLIVSQLLNFWKFFNTADLCTVMHLHNCPLIRHDHKCRRCVMNPRIMWCGSLWTLDILTGPMRCPEVAPWFWFLFYRFSALFLFFFHLGRNRSYCDVGVIPFEQNWRWEDPFGSILTILSRTEHKFMDLGSSFSNRYMLSSCSRTLYIVNSSPQKCVFGVFESLETNMVD